ncbi:MAG: peroxiredoxin [Caulobacterales bacterium]
MYPPARLKIGHRIPNAMLGVLRDGAVSAANTESLFAGRRAVVIGVPGAYTPICTQRHLPQFIEAAPKLRRSGYGLIACIAPNDPFVLARWAADIDPRGELEFYSDGNLEFARAAGVARREPDFFLGERSERYMLTTENAVITRFNVENSIFDIACTRVENVFLV